MIAWGSCTLPLGKLTDEPGVHVLIEYLYRGFYRIDGEFVTVIRILRG